MSNPTFEETQAAAAVRRAKRLQKAASSDVTGFFHGKCRDCGATFDFEYGDDQHMAPCPECGSHEWHRESDDAE